MRYHHTKNKGDLGAIEVMADLTRRGFSILVPLTEHEAFDFVACRDNRFIRVQAKYRAAVDGVVTAPLTTSWADRNGTHTLPIDRDALDVLAIFCPDTGKTYYVDPRTWPRAKVALRINEPRNGQRKGVSWARDFVELPPTVRGSSGGFGLPLVIPRGASQSREPRATWLAYAPVAQLD